MKVLTESEKRAVRAYVRDRQGVERVRVSADGNVYAFGRLRGTNDTGWYFAGYDFDLLVHARAEWAVQHGGARPGAGAPRLVPGQTTESVQVRLDPARKAKALAIGDGNVAKGVRAALDAFQTASLPDTPCDE